MTREERTNRKIIHLARREGSPTDRVFAAAASSHVDTCVCPSSEFFFLNHLTNYWHNAHYFFFSLSVPNLVKINLFASVVRSFVIASISQKKCARFESNVPSVVVVVEQNPARYRIQTERRNARCVRRPTESRPRLFTGDLRELAAQSIDLRLCMCVYMCKPRVALHVYDTSRFTLKSLSYIMLCLTTPQICYLHCLC